MATFNKIHPLDYILPGLLAAMLPLDLIIGLNRGGFPNQATPLSLISLLIALYLLASLRQLPALSPHSENLTMRNEEQETIAANARLNQVLGASFMVFGLLVHLFWLFSILTNKPRLVENRATSGLLVEAGAIALFTLLIAALQFGGSRIYFKGRRETL